MVRIVAFYSDDLSSNPAGYLNLLYKKTKIDKKEAGVGHEVKSFCVSLLLEPS